MDALRASILQSLELEVQHKEAAFIKAIEETDSGSLRGQDHAAAKALMLQQFYQDLYAVCEEQFASAQAAMLTKTNNFRLISTGWTSMGIYMPLVFPDYSVASSLSAGLNNHHPYPFNVTLGHTRIWESAKMGRLFVSLNGGLLLNNTKLIYGLNKLSWTDYKNLGGTDTLRTADEGNHKIYIGPYKTFLTPAVSLRLVYFLPDSHIGCSFLTEQNFGTHNMLNIKLGIPVVLINSKKTPAVTIECYAVFYNVSNKASNADKQGRPWLGLSAGIPFSRLMY